MKKLLFLIALVFFMLPNANATLCFQETANVSICGSGSGGYWTSGDPYEPTHPAHYGYDANYNTFSSAAVGGSALTFMNYSIPINTTYVIWQVKFSSSVTLNYSLPKNCLNLTSKNITFQINSDMRTIPAIYLRCLAPTQWVDLDSGDSNGELYEEGVFWDNRTLSTPPTYGAPSVSGIYAGQHAYFQTPFFDDYGLSSFNFEFDNGNGTVYNTTVGNFNGTANIANASAVLNSTIGSVVRWRFYAFDSDGDMNVTPIQTFTIISGAPKWINLLTNSYFAGKTTTFSMQWIAASTTQLYAWIFEFDNGNGTLQNITKGVFTGTVNTSAVTLNLNSTIGSNIRWRFYANSTTNLTAFSGLSFNDSFRNVSSQFTFQTLGLQNCTTGNKTLQFFFYDEQTTLSVNATLGLSIVANDGVSNTTFNFNITGTNVSICRPIAGVLNADITSVYSYAGYSSRSYHANTSISNVAKNYSLYLLNTADSGELDISLKDNVGNPIAGYTLEIQRYFISTGAYITVAQIVTDYAGRGFTYVYQPAVKYQIIALDESGNVAKVFDNVIVDSSIQTGVLGSGAGIYALELTIGGELNQGFHQFGSISVSCTFDNSTTVLGCVVVDNTGATTSMQLDVSNLTINGWTRICTSSATGSSATLLCTIGDGWDKNLFQYSLILQNPDGTYFTAYSGTLDFRGMVINWGANGFLLTLFTFLTLAAIGAWNPVVALFLGGAGLVFAQVLGAFAVGQGTLIGILLVIVLLVWKSRA